jgi:hypothetical protein
MGLNVLVSRAGWPTLGCRQSGASFHRTNVTGACRAVAAQRRALVARRAAITDRNLISGRPIINAQSQRPENTRIIDV